MSRLSVWLFRNSVWQFIMSVCVAVYLLWLLKLSVWLSTPFVRVDSNKTCTNGAGRQTDSLNSHCKYTDIQTDNADSHTECLGNQIKTSDNETYFPDGQTSFLNTSAQSRGRYKKSRYLHDLRTRITVQVAKRTLSNNETDSEQTSWKNVWTQTNGLDTRTDCLIFKQAV